MTQIDTTEQKRLSWLLVLSLIPLIAIVYVFSYGPVVFLSFLIGEPVWYQNFVESFYVPPSWTAQLLGWESEYHAYKQWWFDMLGQPIIPGLP